MKPFPVSQILQIVRSFERGIGQEVSSEFQVAASATEQEEMVGQLNAVIEECENFSLPYTADHLRRMAEAVRNSVTVAEIVKLFPEVVNRIEDECKRLLCMRIESAHLKYFENPQFFDSGDLDAVKVSAAFPSANEDIAEAGKCLACGRSTACVLHLSRVLEVGLKTVASAVGVAPQNDWGKYLEGIERELNKRVKASGARTQDEQFYAEAHLMFDNMRRAWRNPTMHVEKTYTPERAEEILVAAGSFMRHLATKLHE